MSLLEVDGLCKRYPSFLLSDVSFRVEPGRIMGLIGKNGAGKSTTLKALLHMVRPDSGSIRMFGLDFSDYELSCKQEVGVVLGGIDFYRRKKLSQITRAVRLFYPQWDENAYREYLRLFDLDERKCPDQLSAGMRVKYMLALALSHHARLLILDEPTSGMDPVSRDDLLNLFQALVKDGQRAILFSTHITSDLDKCADDVTYLKGGEVLCSAEKTRFRAAFSHLREPGDPDLLPLEEIMVRTERRDDHDCPAV